MDAKKTLHFESSVMPKAMRATVIGFSCCIVVLALSLFQVSRTGQITASTANQTSQVLAATQQQLETAVATVNALSKSISTNKTSIRALIGEIIRLRTVITLLGGDPGPALVSPAPSPSPSPTKSPPGKNKKPLK